MKVFVSGFLLLVGASATTSCEQLPARNAPIAQTSVEADSTYKILFEAHPAFMAYGFDFPVGPPDGHGYYNAQPFGKNNHLGDDWNGRGGGNTDMGDPVYAVAHGFVRSAANLFGGWGSVVRIVHCAPRNADTLWVESLYAHLDTMLVKPGHWIKKGEQLGTIGNAGGIYLAHLHLELRDSVDMETGGGYGTDTRGYLDPTAFIRSNRSK